MALLAFVSTDLSDQGFKNAALVIDRETGQHYVIASGESPWMPEYTETLVWATEDGADPLSIRPLDHVAGGEGMDLDEALADLSARLDDGMLRTPAQAAELNAQKAADQSEAFLAWFALGTQDDYELTN